MKIIIVLAVISLFIYGCGSSVEIPSPHKNAAQISKEEEQKLQEAIRYHDNGEYEKAVSIYHDLLKSNPDNVLAIYEISYSLFMLKDYKECLEYSLKGMEFNSELLNKFYVNAGNALDNLHKPEEAVSIYKKGIEQNPDDYMLYFNIAISYINLKKYNEAEDNLIKSIKKNPLHASSHLALAEIYKAEGRQIPSLLLLLRFLVLEPNSNRSRQALSYIDELTGLGVEKKSEGKININVFSQESPDSPYSMLELSLKVIKAASYAGENKGKSAWEIKLNEISSLVKLIQEQPIKNSDDFTANYLFPYFSEIEKKGFTDVFKYYVHQSDKNQEITEWLDKNDNEVNSFLAWNKVYEWTIL